MRPEAVVIRGGTVYDGSGAPGVEADVVVRGDRIAAVGPGAGDAVAGARVIDATGRAVAPGFIDIHTHSDVVPFMREPQPFKVLQGVTTEVVGNCGNSAAPLVDDDAVRAHRPMSSTDAAGVSSWPRDLAGYLDAAEAAGPTNHLASLVGHHTLRISANGMDERLRPGALQRMVELADEAFAQGAFGLSTGLLYAPGSYADEAEVEALVAVAARWQRVYTTHMRDEGDGLSGALAEAIGVARRTGARLQISHCKAAGRRNAGRGAELLETMRRARAEGVDVFGDQYPYTTGESFLTALLPASAQAGGRDALRERLADPQTRAQLLAQAERGGAGSGAWHQTTPEGISISMHRDTSLLGRTLAELAAASGRAPFDELARLITADPAAMMVYELMDEGDVRRILADPLIAIGSDNSVPVGNAHQRGWGCFPRVLGEYVRERGLLELGEAVRRMTSLPARIIGLPGRGHLRAGAIADVVVFDPRTVGHRGSPARPWVTPDGIVATLLAGRPVVEDGEFTGERAGRVLRAGMPEPAGSGR
ncbi:D-aminoacylase [Microbacterium sp. Marseille-Q6965]|uniref:N-acyl-D-amino-acid deacylase family protein n=1 Tax=Microbacterium sp. Marseille-Q6965 TaxID=2965072 RepID=UPI0028E0A219|nr:D-aminoacylase [Microbacterium sp. Marseille-Q6965]